LSVECRSTLVSIALLSFACGDSFAMLHQGILDTMKYNVLMAKDKASVAAVTARCEVGNGMGAVKDKIDAAASGPLVKHAFGSLSNKLATASSAMKLGVGTVKDKCDAATPLLQLEVDSVRDKLATAGLVAKLGVGTMKDQCDAVMKDKADTVRRLRNTVQTPPTESVEQLVAMGFARNDVLRAFCQVGSGDMDAIVTVLCNAEGRGKSPGSVMLRTQAALVRSRMASEAALVRSREVMAGVFPRRVNEASGVEFDEEEDLQHALLLSRLQAEMSWKRSQPKSKDVWDGMAHDESNFDSVWEAMLLQDNIMPQGSLSPTFVIEDDKEEEEEEVHVVSTVAMGHPAHAIQASAVSVDGQLSGSSSPAPWNLQPSVATWLIKPVFRAA